MKIWVLGSGSKGNAVLVECDGSRMLVDCGYGTRNLTKRLKTIDVDPRSIDGCLITHEHTDHAPLGFVHLGIRIERIRIVEEAAAKNERFMSLVKRAARRRQPSGGDGSSTPRPAQRPRQSSPESTSIDSSQGRRSISRA